MNQMILRGKLISVGEAKYKRTIRDTDQRLHEEVNARKDVRERQLPCGGLWGEVARCDELTESCLSFTVGRILIDTCVLDVINEWIPITIGTSGYDVFVKKIGWEIYGTGSLSYEAGSHDAVKVFVPEERCIKTSEVAWDPAAELILTKGGLVVEEKGRIGQGSYGPQIEKYVAGPVLEARVDRAHCNVVAGSLLGQGPSSQGISVPLGEGNGEELQSLKGRQRGRALCEDDDDDFDGDEGSIEVGCAQVEIVDPQVTCAVPCGDDGQSLIGGREAMIVDTAVENANYVVEETPDIMLEGEENHGAQVLQYVRRDKNNSRVARVEGCRHRY
ncbi:uncharacterized protein DS421_15g497340 [Arachis hypogaea]|nr:uncharacterized protein DS421_15g497340 [Arachis hypogaea]